jgi:hypothetical protein
MRSVVVVWHADLAAATDRRATYVTVALLALCVVELDATASAPAARSVRWSHRIAVAPSPR